MVPSRGSQDLSNDLEVYGAIYLTYTGKLLVYTFNRNSCSVGGPPLEFNREFNATIKNLSYVIKISHGHYTGVL